jgi:hypothetical protein
VISKLPEAGCFCYRKWRCLRCQTGRLSAAAVGCLYDKRFDIHFVKEDLDVLRPVLH